jgi:hypothetical protein
MNTRTAEIKVLLEDILKEALQQGIAPDVTELINSRDFRNLGIPKRGDPINGITSDSNEINSNLGAIEQNTKILDEAAGLQTDSTVAHRGSFQSRVSALDRWYKRLAYRAENLLLLSRSGNGSLYSISESFTSLDGLDMTRTTAYIDTTNGMASINYDSAIYDIEAETGGANVTLSGARLTDIDKTVNLPIVDGRISYKYESASRSGVEIDVALTVNMLNDIYKGGYIEFDVGFPDNTILVGDITATSDGINYEKLSCSNRGGHYVIPVSMLYVDEAISFKLRKTDHEGTKVDAVGRVTHQFFVEIKNIRLPNRLYRSGASVYSILYPLPEILQQRGVGQYKITVDSLATGDNHIDAYIAIGTGEYQQVEVGKTQSLGQTETRQSYHVACTTIQDVPNAITKVEGITGQPVMDLSQLYEGWGQAEVESVLYDISYSSLSAWARYPGTPAYQDMGTTGVFLGAGMAHKVYFNVKSDTIKELVVSDIGVKSQEVSENQATFTTFYFNGQLVQGKSLPNGTLEYRLTLIKGVNTFNLLVGVSGNYGGRMNIQSQIARTGLTTYVKARRCTSVQAIIGLDAEEKAYAVQNGTILLNYIPPVGAKFMHIYTLPTASIPEAMSVRLDLIGDGTLSPICEGYHIEFSPGSIA